VLPARANANRADVPQSEVESRLAGGAGGSTVSKTDRQRERERERERERARERERERERAREGNGRTREWCVPRLEQLEQFFISMAFDPSDWDH
jgi:hypothetical protein